MRVVITGTSGFIGSYLFRAAREAYGAQVTAFTSRTTEGNHVVYQANEHQFGLTHEDLSVIRGAEILIHAGAFIPKTAAEMDDRAKCTTNVTFTDKLLHLPWTKLKKVIFLSSTDVYGQTCGPISEDSPTSPSSLYGQSKLYGESLISLFASEQGIPGQILRLGHVYGPGEADFQKLIPQTLQSIVSGRGVRLRGDGQERRSFIFVEDAVDAILRSISLEETPGPINVVGEESRTIFDVVSTIIAVSGTEVRVIQEPATGIPRDLVFDSSKLRRYLPLQETDFITGLRAEFDDVRRLGWEPR